MTKEEMEIIGVSRIAEGVYNVPFLGEINLDNNTSVTDILKQIWVAGSIHGKKIGSTLKTQEIKKALGIED